MNQRPSLLLVSHAYAAVENRKKVQALALHFDLVCVTSALSGGTVLGRAESDFDNESDAPQRAYQLVRLPRRSTRGTTFAYQGLFQLMRSRSFDFVLVENEPWAVICWQTRLYTLLLQSRAQFGVFTWENVERPGWKGSLLSIIYRLWAATTHFIIAGNRAAADIAVKYGANRASVQVAAQIGVDLVSYQPVTGERRSELRRASGLSAQGKCIIGYCGRLIEEKGLRELLAACDELEGIELALLGAGLLSGWLEEQAKTRPWLRLLPPRPHFEVPDFLRCLDIFVLPSKPVHDAKNCWEEQFGHVLIEAMACRVLTLGSTSGAIPEVLGMPEVIFPWGDAAALNRLLHQLITSPEKLASLRQRQHSYNAANYSHEAVAVSWADFIRSQIRS